MRRAFLPLLQRCLIALSLIAALAADLPSVSANPPETSALKDQFFSQTGRGDGSGYFVLDEGTDPAGQPMRFWSEFRRYGGVDALGYPISRRFSGAGGFVYQAFQRGILQWRPESANGVLANTFDWLQEAGRDGWLDALGVPPPVADDGSAGDWNSARDARMGWLTDKGIKTKFLSSPAGEGDWTPAEAIQYYGLPMSRPEKRGPFVIQRFQRVAFQHWLENVPGMPPAGSVVAVLGGEMLKQSGLIPGEASAPESADGSVSPTKGPMPTHVKALYLSMFAAANNRYRQSVFDIAAETDINAVVVDVKSERGPIAYRSEVPLATAIGASARPTIANFGELMAMFRQRGLYVIARLPVFKDDLLATARPSLAVTDATSGGPWRDAAGLAWTDPFLEEVWQYNIALAEEAARMGVDEIQFDYIRFPAVAGGRPARFAKAAAPGERSAAIVGFLAKARAVLAPLGVRIGADLFGYTVWRKDELSVGQQMDEMARHLDVVSPMLYPSNFTDGIPGYRPGVLYPYEVVARSTQEAVSRLRQMPVVVRPWLQDFADYTYDKRPFTPEMVAAQIRGAMDGGAQGWMLWNPFVHYKLEALSPR